MRRTEASGTRRPRDLSCWPRSTQYVEGVTSYERTLKKVLKGDSDANIRFADLTSILTALGFDERIKGSHHIFSRKGVEEILNLQPVSSKAKA